MVLRLVNGLGAALFGYAAWVQLNDPDPLQWVVAYGAASLLCLLAAVRRAPPLATTTFGVGMAISAVWSAQAEPVGHAMEGFPSWEPLQEETVRETLGLALISLWMIPLGIGSWFRGRPAPQDA